jgi:hypothetical protein
MVEKVEANFCNEKLGLRQDLVDESATDDDEYDDRTPQDDNKHPLLIVITWIYAKLSPLTLIVLEIICLFAMTFTVLAAPGPNIAKMSRDIAKLTQAVSAAGPESEAIHFNVIRSREDTWIWVEKSLFANLFRGEALYLGRSLPFGGNSFQLIQVLTITVSSFVYSYNKASDMNVLVRDH